MSLKYVRNGVYRETKKTLYERLATQISRSLPCPISGSGGRMITRIDRRSFAKLCRWHQAKAARKNAFSGVTAEENVVCVGCVVGVRVKDGRQFGPPAGVCFVPREQLLMERARGK